MKEKAFGEGKRQYKYVTNHSQRGFSWHQQVYHGSFLWQVYVIYQDKQSGSPLSFALTQVTETTAHVLNIIYKKWTPCLPQ